MVETRSGKMQDPAQERIQAEESAKPQPGATIGRDASSDPVVLNPNIDIPKYDGTEDPRPWIESLEEIGFLYHWADYIISRYAAMNMTGSAKTWLNLHKASFTSWENIKIRLIQDFSLDASKEELRMKLNRMQHWNEPAIRFAEDILVLCNKVDPAMEEETKIEHVIGGLKKEYSFALYLNPPKTTDDLLVVCKKMDSFEKKYRERVEKSRNLYNGPRYSRPQQQLRYVPPTAARNYQTTSRPQAPVSNNYKNDSPPTPRQYRNNFPQPATPRRPYNPNFVPKPNLQRNTYNKSQEVSKNRTEDGRPICFKCNKPGHVARYCRVKFIRILEEDPADTQEKVEEKCQMNYISEKSGPRLYADVSPFCNPKENPLKTRGSVSNPKTALLSPPILGHFNPNAPTYVHTDASNIGIGARLVQDIGGEEKVISYLSRTLSKAEQNYSTTEKECLAVVWSMSKLRPYLYGRHFKIVTDHHALCWLKNLKDPTGRLARWALKIQEYDFDIIHKSGKKHLDADGLSRGPLPETDWDEDFERLFLNQITDEEDKFIESVKKNLNGSRRSIAQNFKEEDGCLFKKNPNPEGRAWLLVVPENKKREIMKEYHNHMSNGHLGVARTMYRIKSKYFWPSMLKDVSEFVKTCHLCQSRKGSNQLPSGLLQPLPPANFPFERIGIDFVGPLPSTKNRKKWIIVLTDYYTRYAETRAVSEATVKEVSKFLVEDIFLRHGAPQYLISDKGSQFTSNLMKEVMKTCKIKHCFTTSYHPQTNGLTERLNRTLINMLSMYVNTDQKNWDEILPFITHAYNTTIQETTGYSPFFLMFGREPTSLLDDRNISVDIDKDDYDEYIKHHLDKINRTRKLVINNTIKTQERMKKNYDKKHMERSYEPGELVAVWTPIRKIGKCEKLLRKYFGPYRILKKLSNVNYLIEPKDNPGQDPLIVHVSRLKPYFERIDEVTHEDMAERQPFSRYYWTSGSAGKEPGRPSIPSPTGGQKLQKDEIQKTISRENSENRENANPPAGVKDVNLAAARDVTLSLPASTSFNGAARVLGNWADCIEDLGPEADDAFTVVKGKKRRRESTNSPTAAAPSSNIGGARTSRRPQSSAGSVPRAQEIRTTRAHISEARARQASSSEDHCVYLEHGPELQPFHYLRALDRMLGGTAGVIQVSKAGPYTYNDGRREAFIVLHDGVTTERLPTRLDIPIKGEAWPAYLSSGIKCSRCHGQGHRRANCPLLAGRANTTRSAPPASPAGLQPTTTPAPPQRPTPQHSAPAPPLEISGASPAARAAIHPAGAPRPSPTAPSASPTEETPPAPPPVTPDPSSQAPRDPASQEILGPANITQDIEMTAVEESIPPSASSNKKCTRIDLAAFIKRSPSVSFAGTDALGLGREEVLDLLSSRTKAHKRGRHLTPPQSNALAGLVNQILDLRPGGDSNSTIYKVLRQVLSELRTGTAAVPPAPTLPAPRPAEPAPPAPQKRESTPAMATPPPPPSAQMEVDPIDKRCKELQLLTFELMKEFNPKPLPQFYSFELDLVEAVGITSRMATSLVRAESPSKAEEKPARHGMQAHPCAELTAKQDLQKNFSISSSEDQRYANPPTGVGNANLAAARGDVTTGSAAATSSNGAARVLGNWADYTEDQRPGEDDDFTVVRNKRRRRDSPGSPTAAKHHSNPRGAGANSRPRSSTGWVPRAEEIKTTRAHIAEARARQASSAEDNCVYVEYSPELEPYHYIRAVDRMIGGTNNVFQVSKINGHYLMGLNNRGLAERLISEGLEVEGTLFRAFPFRKRAMKITVGNLPFFVEDFTIISALTPYGRVTSIAPKLMKAGPYIYNDGRRDAFIVLHEGVTTERLPTRLEIKIKGEVWPAYLSYGIRCSRCHGQGHRRANCPLLAGRSNAPRPATPTSPTGVPPVTTPRPPQPPSAQPPPPASPSPAMEVSEVPSTSRAALHPPAAPRQSPPVAPAIPTEMAPPAAPPVTPAPSLRAPGSHGPAVPTLDVEMSIEETSTSSTSSSGTSTREGLVTFLERNPGVSFAQTDALGLGREEVLDLLSSKTKARKRGPLLSPSQGDALAGLIRQLLGLKPGGNSNIYKVLGQVRAALKTSPAAVPPTPPLPAPQPAGPIPPAPDEEEMTPIMREECMVIEIFKKLKHLTCLRPLYQSGIQPNDLKDAILFIDERESLMARLTPAMRGVLAEFLSAAIEPARGNHPDVSSDLAKSPGCTRQASCTEEQCLYLEYCPDYQSYQYLRAIERVVGGHKNIFQFSKINGHYLLGLASKSLAEHLVREGLEIEGTLIRTFPFRKSSTRITVGNLPFFVADAAIIDALSRYGRITSIAPKLLKAGEFTYTDGRREAFILLHDGITIDKLPTRFEIKIKGEAWPAFLSHGIKCSKCHGQGHRRANCPQLHGRSATARRASPPPSTDLPPSTAPGLPRQSSAAPPSPSNKASRAPSDSCAASLPSAAPWPSTPAPPASPMQAVTPAPPPMTPSPEDPMGPRSAASRPESTPPARPDFIAPCGLLPAQGTLGPATHTPDVDMTTTEEPSAPSPAAVSTPPLPAPQPAGPTPSAPHKEDPTPAMTPPSPPPTPMEEDLPPNPGDCIHRILREIIISKIDPGPLVDDEVSWTDAIDAILHSHSRAPFLARLSPILKKNYAVFLEAAIERARDSHPRILS
ncbi:hypothetical protein LAZ67_9000031, partial [Cordylochernes scorpioides]